jgi:AcrR family transcriptional regulator
MVYQRHNREDILTAAKEGVAEDGLHQLTFGRLANRLGIADRTVVYYFPTKEQLVTDVVGAFAADLLSVLDVAFGSEPRSAPELLDRAWPELTTEKADRVFRVFFELVGLAAACVEPYTTLAPTIIDEWVNWLTPRLTPTDLKGKPLKLGSKIDPNERRGQVLAFMATLDGLLLIRHTIGAPAAATAASALGITPLGITPLGITPLGITPLGITPLGILRPKGAKSKGVKSKRRP